MNPKQWREKAEAFLTEALNHPEATILHLACVVAARWCDEEARQAEAWEFAKAHFAVDGELEGTECDDGL